MLTNEDHIIFRAQMSVAAQAALHKADRAAANTMRLGIQKMLCLKCGSVLSAATNTCVRGTFCR